MIIKWTRKIFRQKHESELQRRAEEMSKKRAIERTAANITKLVDELKRKAK